jgi:hypothetical protein
MATSTARRFGNDEESPAWQQHGRWIAVAACVAGLLIGGLALALVKSDGGADSATAGAQAPSAAPAGTGVTADQAELAAARAEAERLRRQNKELVTTLSDAQKAGAKQTPGTARPDGRAASAPAAPVPEAERWIVLFRADDPSAWDSPSYTAERFAVPLHLVPDFRYLRLRRMDTGEALILQMSRDQLRNDKPPRPDTGYFWNGASSLAWEGRHLGIAQGPRYKFPVPNGMICVMMEGWDAFAGSGFGHKAFVNDHQYWCWRGQEIPRTVFEIAVTAGPVTAEEEQYLVGGP